MDVKGKIIVFVEDKEIKEGKKIKVFSTTISHKEEDGSFTNTKLEVRFNKDKFPYEHLAKLDSHACYTFDLIEAWLDVRGFTTKEGKAGRQLFLRIADATLKESKPIKKDPALKNLPF